MKNFDNPIDEMLYILIKENEQKIPENLSNSDKRWLIDSLVVVRSPGHVNERFKELHDQMLKNENASMAIDCEAFKFRKHFAVTKKDITDLNVECIYCETVDYMGCIVPDLKCLDNRLLIKDGLGVREECSRLNSENGYLARTGSAFCLSGGNLNCGGVVKFILPQVRDMLKYDVDKIKLAICSAMDILRERGVKMFAFNLDVDRIFNISQEMYIRIVINTIIDYMRKHRYKANCVFSIKDDESENLVKGILKLKQVY